MIYNISENLYSALSETASFPGAISKSRRSNE